MKEQETRNQTEEELDEAELRNVAGGRQLQRTNTRLTPDTTGGGHTQQR